MKITFTAVLALPLFLALADPAAAQGAPLIAFVEVFGGSAGEKTEAALASGLCAGDRFDHRAIDAARERLLASGRFQDADVFAWRETQNGFGVLIDIVGAKDPAPPATARKPGRVRDLPTSILEAVDSYQRAFQAAMSARPGTAPWQRLKAAAARCGREADRHAPRLIAVIAHEQDPLKIASAALAAGYARSRKSLPDLAAALAGRFDDPLVEIRNAALRSAALLQKRNAALKKPLFKLEDALRAFSRPSVLDRQKAGGLLEALIACDPKTRAKVRDAALARARAIARTRLSMHRRGGLALLREIQGEKRLDDKAWLAWLKKNNPQDLGWWQYYAAQKDQTDY